MEKITRYTKLTNPITTYFLLLQHFYYSRLTLLIKDFAVFIPKIFTLVSDPTQKKKKFKKKKVGKAAILRIIFFVMLEKSGLI